MSRRLRVVFAGVLAVAMWIVFAVVRGPHGVRALDGRAAGPEESPASSSTESRTPETEIATPSRDAVAIAENEEPRSITAPRRATAIRGSLALTDGSPLPFLRLDLVPADARAVGPLFLGSTSTKTAADGSFEFVDLDPDGGYRIREPYGSTIEGFPPVVTPSEEALRGVIDADAVLVRVVDLAGAAVAGALVQLDLRGDGIEHPRVGPRHTGVEGSALLLAPVIRNYDCVVAGASESASTRDLWHPGSPRLVRHTISVDPQASGGLFLVDLVDSRGRPVRPFRAQILDLSQEGNRVRLLDCGPDSPFGIEGALEPGDYQVDLLPLFSGARSYYFDDVDPVPLTIEAGRIASAVLTAELGGRLHLIARCDDATDAERRRGLDLWLRSADDEDRRLSIVVPDTQSGGYTVAARTPLDTWCHSHALLKPGDYTLRYVLGDRVERTAIVEVREGEDVELEIDV